MLSFVLLKKFTFLTPPPYLPLSVNASVVVDAKDQTHLRSSAALH